MRNFECSTCGNNNLQQVTFGSKIADVIDISVDDGLVCCFKAFEPCPSTRVSYRCGSCQAIVEVAENDIVNFLKFGRVT